MCLLVTAPLPLPSKESLKGFESEITSTESSVATTPVMGLPPDMHVVEGNQLQELACMLSHFATQQALFHARILHRLDRLEQTVRTVAANQEVLAKSCKKKKVHIDTQKNIFHDPLPSPVNLNMNSCRKGGARVMAGTAAAGFVSEPDTKKSPSVKEDTVECPVCHKQIPKSSATHHVNQHFEVPTGVVTEQNTTVGSQGTATTPQLQRRGASMSFQKEGRDNKVHPPGSIEDASPEVGCMFAHHDDAEKSGGRPWSSLFQRLVQHVPNVLK